MSLIPSTDAVELQTFQQHVLNTLSTGKGERLDKRRRDDFRDMNVITNVLSDQSTFGSSCVACGKSSIQCAVKAAFGPPLESTPNEGRLEVSVQLPFAANFVDAVSDARKVLEVFLADVLRTSVALEQFAVLAGEACWVVYVDVSIIGSDGNLRAACLAAAVAALQTARFPRAKLPNDTFSTAFDVALRHIPVAVTASSVQNNYLVDATSVEESVSDGDVTVVVEGSTLVAGKVDILYISHHGGSPMTARAIEYAVTCLAEGMRSRAYLSSLLKPSIQQ